MLDLGSKTEREIEDDFATLNRGGKPTNRNVRLQTQGQKGRLGALRILTEKDLRAWKLRNEESMKGKWEVIEGVVDSGAVDTVTNKDTVKFTFIKETNGRKEEHSGPQRMGISCTTKERNSVRVSQGKAHRRECHAYRRREHHFVLSEENKGSWKPSSVWTQGRIGSSQLENKKNIM
jgi:hypothetical protein